MNKYILSVTYVVFVFSTVVTPCYAYVSSCDKLSGEASRLAKEILEEQHPYSCCDDTIAQCLRKKPICALVHRLVENICKRVAEHQSKDRIFRAIAGRARTMMLTGVKAKIVFSTAAMAGDPNAPVLLVEYACARCPYCSKITPELYQTIVNGQLKGKVRFFFKTFPIRGHRFSKETGLGFIAAAKMNLFWEFLLYSYNHFDGFCVDKQSEWAEAVGIDREKFEHILADPNTRTLLVDSKKEGIVNRVDATPTFFINGRKYMGEINLTELTDILEEEYERTMGIKYLK